MCVDVCIPELPLSEQVMGLKEVRCMVQLCLHILAEPYSKSIHLSPLLLSHFPPLSLCQSHLATPQPCQSLYARWLTGMLLKLQAGRPDLLSMKQPGSVEQHLKTTFVILFSLNISEVDWLLLAGPMSSLI